MTWEALNQLRSGMYSSVQEFIKEVVTKAAMKRGLKESGSKLLMSEYLLEQSI